MKRLRAATAAGMLVLLALALPQVRAATTGTWSVSGSNSATTTINDLTITHTGATGSGNYANDNLQTTTSNWWNNPYGGAVSGGPALRGSYVPGSGTLNITVTFSHPVTNPVMHVGRVGGVANGGYNSAVWELNSFNAQSSNVAMQRIGANSVFVLDADNTPGFRRLTGGNSTNSDADCNDSGTGKACGSIRFNGTGITQLKFNITMRGGAGLGDVITHRWSVSDADTNRPTLRLRKRVLGTTGTFSLSATNGYGTESITVSTPDTTEAGPIKVLNNANTTTVITEAAPSSNTVFAGATCSGLANGATPIVDLANRTVTLPAAGMTADADVACTLFNRTPIITLFKALGEDRVAANDQFSVAIRTGGANGTVVSSTAAATTTGSGATVDPGTGTTGAYYGTAGTAFTLTEAAASGTNLAKYNARLTCTDVEGVTSAANLPNDEPFNPATGRTIVPTTGADLRCVITNTPNLPRISGRVFLDNGRGGGTANDGIPNGTEEPLAGTAMRLTNCAGTVHASTLTDGSGNYRFGIPAGLASGASLCVEQTDGPARISTGASVGTTALPSGTAVTVGGTSYIYTRTSTPDRIALQWNGASHEGLNFGDVDGSTFAASGARTGPPGSTVSFAHVFTAGTAGAVRFSIASETSAPPITGWNTRILADTGCTGQLQPGAAQLYPPQAAGTAVAQGGKVCIVVQQFIPSNAPEGALHTAVVRADFDFSAANPSVARSFTLQDTTTVSNAALELQKEVRNLTQNAAFGLTNQARPQETLEYRVRFTNNGPVPLHGVALADTTPAYTTFVSASVGSTPAALGTCSKATPANPPPAAAVPCADTQPVGGTGAIGWKFTGAIDPGATGTVLFQVRVD